MRDTYAPDGHDAARLLPEILDDLLEVLPDHPATAYVVDLKRRADAIRAEFDALSDLTDTMARALRNNNYDYSNPNSAPGSRLLPDLGRLMALRQPPAGGTHDPA